MKRENTIFWYELIKVVFMLIGLIMCLSSCGARKVQKQQSKEENKTELSDNSVIEKQIDTNVKTTTTVVVNDKDELITTEEEIKPLDSSKPALFTDKTGKQIELNNSIYTKKTKISKNNTQSNSSNLSSSSKKEAEKENKNVFKKDEYKKESKSKEVKKEQFNWYNLLWFVIPIGIIYYFYRRYKVF